MQIDPHTLRFIRDHAGDDVRALALQARKYPEVDLPVAIVQIAGRQAAREKIPSWAATEGILYPRHLSLEQCSSEVTARYKASLVSVGRESLVDTARESLVNAGRESLVDAGSESLVDLTGGFGIDCAFLASRFRQATYVERQEELCEIAAHNFPLLGLNALTVCPADGVEYLQQMPPADWIFIDPARRNEQGGKTVSIADCEPDVAQLEETLLAKARRVMVKLSPMLDLSLALHQLKHVDEAHIVSVNNECKELLLLLSREHPREIPIHCVNLTGRKEPHPSGESAGESIHPFTFTREQEQTAACPLAAGVENYLYEPNASLLKAGAFRSVAAIYHVKKLHPNSHLYTSDQYVEEFPGRVFRVVSTTSFNKKEMKDSLGDVRKANLTVRNFPAPVAELRKRLKLAEGGDTYLFATTLSDESKVLIRCEKHNIANSHIAIS